MKVFLLFSLLVIAVAYPNTSTDSEWESFKSTYNKDYSSNTEEQQRKEIFMDNLKFVNNHNELYHQGKFTYDVAINQFSDLTNEEFRNIYTGLRLPDGYNRTGTTFETTGLSDIPDKKDWREEGAVTPVKNQESCGSCWAFSSTGAIEGMNFLETKNLVSLSEQNLIDCSTEEGNNGCRGGLMDFAFKYVKDNNGIDTEQAYPYNAVDETCEYKKEGVGAKISGYVDIKSGSEEQLQQAIAFKGPVSVAIDVSNPAFQHYNSGVYVDHKCKSDVRNLDHAVLAVGYAHDESQGSYYIVKNSWGTQWGMEGYILMAMNQNNMCGIATSASYPTP